MSFTEYLVEETAPECGKECRRFYFVTFGEGARSTR